MLSSVGSRYGYFPNATKTILIVKETVLTDARTIFGDCDIQVTAEGHRYLGGVIGTPAFEQLFLKHKVDGWIDDLKTLSLFAETQPHASYAAFCHGLSFRWNYFFRVSSCSTDLFLPLEHFVTSVFLPSLLGRAVPGDVERKLFALPVRLGGLGVFDPSIVVSQQCSCSVEVNAGLVGLIISQVHQLGDCLDAQVQLRSKFHSRSHQEQLQSANHLFNEHPPSMRSSVMLA